MKSASQILFAAALTVTFGIGTAVADDNAKMPKPMPDRPMGNNATTAQPLPPTATDAAKEQATAAFHAGLAAGSGDVKMVHAHLHHVINCLVGPTGASYAMSEMNPCKGMGAGLLTDTSQGASLKQFETALTRALAGLKIDDLMKAKQIAAETQVLLK